MDKYLYEESRLKLAHKAFSMGIWALALVIIFSFIPYIGMGLGCLAIVFAVLSKGYKSSIDKDAKIGIGLASIAICIGVITVGSSFYKLATDSVFRSEVFSFVEEYSNAMYGDEEATEEIMDLYEDLLGGKTNDSDLQS